MARVRFLHNFITREPFFQECSTGMNFRRIVGALAWPFKEKAGCAVVLGETCSRQNILGTRRHDVHKLEEKQSLDPAELLDMTVIMAGQWMVKSWATPLCDRRSYLLEDVNEERRRMRRPALRYGDPLGFSGKGEGLLLFYHSLVQRRTMSEKTLFLGHGACADEIAGLRYADESTSILEFPGPAALCFALAEIDVDPLEEWGDKKDWSAFGPADDLGGY